MGKYDLSTRIIPGQKAFSLFTRRSNHRPIHGFRLRRPDPNGPWEPEEDWFKAALSKAGKLVPLTSLTPPEIQKNHEKWIYKHMYQDERCALMHAKQGRDEDYLLPQDGVNRDQLIASLGRLSSYIRKLIEAHPDLGVRYRGGHLTDAARRLGAQAVFHDHVVVVSDDAGPVNPQGVNAISETAAIVELQSGAPTEDPDDPGFWTVLAPLRRRGSEHVDGHPEVRSEADQRRWPGVRSVRAFRSAESW